MRRCGARQAVVVAVVAFLTLVHPASAVTALAAGMMIEDAEALQWETLTPIPQARSELAAAVMGQHIYVVGGFGGGDRVDRFDVETGEWERMADLPVGVHRPWVTAFNGRVYVAGGYSLSNHREVSSVWAYDPENDRWEPRADLPTPREHLAVVASEDRLFAIGGRADGDEGDEFAAANEAYDPETDTWEKLPPLPTPAFAGATVANDVVFTGGLDGVLRAFDAATGRLVWTYQAGAGLNAPPSDRGRSARRRGSRATPHTRRR